MSRWIAVELPCVGHEPTTALIDTSTSSCTATFTDWAEGEAAAMVLNFNETEFNRCAENARNREPF